MAVSTATAVVLVLVALAVNLLVNRVAHAHLAAGLMLVVCLAAIAAAAGLAAADVGLARTTWARGLRWGATAAAVVALGYGLAYVVPGSGAAVPDPADTTRPATLVTVLVLIPLGTVLPEELAFRGVLWSLLARARHVRVATLVSSGLFGLWHVLPALGGGPANETVTGAVGSDAMGSALRIAGTVLFTAMAGVVLCELRRRSDSLLTPILLHWAANGLGAIFVMVA